MNKSIRALQRKQAKDRVKEERRKDCFRARRILKDVEFEGPNAPIVAKILGAAGYPNRGPDVVIAHLLEAALTAGMLTGEDAESVAEKLAGALESVRADKTGYDGRSWLEIEQEQRKERTT